MTMSNDYLKLGLAKAPTPISACHPHPGTPDLLSVTLTRGGARNVDASLPRSPWSPGVLHRLGEEGHQSLLDIDHELEESVSWVQGVT